MIHQGYQLRTKAEIAPVQFIIEGYEGMATVSTLDAENAVICVSVMPDFEKDMAGLLLQLEADFHIRQVPVTSGAAAKMNSPTRSPKRKAHLR